MRTVLALMNRNRKLFFKDKGMLFTSMITPVILIVLYATFLAKVFRDSFTAAIPDMITISDELINGTVAAQLTASLMAVSCITVTFCVNLTMVQERQMEQGRILMFHRSAGEKSIWDIFSQQLLIR